MFSLLLSCIFCTNLLTYDKALYYAKKDDKHIVLIFGARWCGWCEKMEEETLSRPSIKKKLKNFIYLELDTDKCPRYLVQKFKVHSLPYYIIIDYNQKVLKKGKGFRNEKDFGGWLDEHIRQTRRRIEKNIGRLKQRSLRLGKSRFRKEPYDTGNFRE